MKHNGGDELTYCWWFRNPIPNQLGYIYIYSIYNINIVNNGINYLHLNWFSFRESLNHQQYPHPRRRCLSGWFFPTSHFGGMICYPTWRIISVRKWFMVPWWVSPPNRVVSICKWPNWVTTHVMSVVAGILGGSHLRPLRHAPTWEIVVQLFAWWWTVECFFLNRVAYVQVMEWEKKCQHVSQEPSVIHLGWFRDLGILKKNHRLRSQKFSQGRKFHRPKIAQTTGPLCTLFTLFFGDFMVGKTYN